MSLQNPERASGPNKRIKINRFLDIDDFYDSWSLEYQNNLETMSKEINADLISPSSLQDAEKIVQIYTEVYRGTYPFPEMLDKNWIFARFSDPQYNWGLFITKETQEIIGCWTIVLDFINGTGYMRGLMVRPQFQKRFNLKLLCEIMTWQVMHKHRSQITKWYCEARTAHSISQYLMTVMGSNLLGLFLNKDYFYGIKETDALMVAYSPRCLSELRILPIAILPEVMPLFEYTQMLLGLPNVPVYPIKHNLDPSSSYSYLAELKVTIEKDEHNYHMLSVIHAKSETKLTGVYTPAVKNIEKVKIEGTKPEAIYATILFLSIYTMNLGIEYVEIQCASSELITQQILLEWGFQPYAYLPAWLPRQKKYEDCIIFGWTKISPDLARMELIPEGKLLFSRIAQKNARFGHD
jgi:hypothetical protein